MSAFDDYLQLLNNNPKMDATKQFGGRAINNINSAAEGYSQWQRLQDQNFKPNQSVIASSFMHPQKGLSKLADWFTNNVNTAAGLPDPNQQDEASMYAYGPNIEQQAESGLNLAGLLQTGAFASGAAPKSAGGTLGSMRIPSDTVRVHDWLDNGIVADVTQKQGNILNTVQSYFKKNWGGENDQLVKYIDEGGRLNGMVGPSLENPTNGPLLGKNYSKSAIATMLDTANNGNRMDDDLGASIYYTHEQYPDALVDTPTQKIMDYINERGNVNDEYERHIGSIQNVADTARGYRGTNQIAKTDAGRYFENLNDLHYLRGLRKSQLPGEYLANSNPNWDVRKIAEKASGNANRTSLIDLLKQSNEYDDYMVTDVAKNKIKMNQDAQLARATPVHNIGDEFTWYKVPDSAAAKVEGQIRDNCLKEDWMQNRIDQGESEIYSLRDKNGRPKVTAEFGDTGLGSPGWVQFKGMSNSEPKSKYQPYIDSLTKDYEPYPDFPYDWLSDD